MPDSYYNPYRRESVSGRYADLGSGYYQDLTTGQVKRRTSNMRQHPSGYYDVEDQTENLYEQRFARANQFKRELSQYDQMVEAFKDRTLRSFNTASEYQGARAAAGLAQSVGQFAQRRGLGDEFTAALSAEQVGQARQQITQANLDFNAKLDQLLNAERIGFIKGEFDYIHRLAAMDYAQELSKDMARFQADLANDFSLQGALEGLMEIGGTALGIALL